MYYSTSGTGIARVGFASSTVAGFAVPAFAPMPMFASFGILTALMIAMPALYFYTAGKQAAKQIGNDNTPWQLSCPFNLQKP